MSENTILTNAPKSDREKAMIQLAEEILTNARNTLLVNFRFLDVALNQFTWVPYPNVTMCTDGKYLFYDPYYILYIYRENPNICTRNYLHLVLHCVFQHMYGAENMRSDLWDLACDVSVEATITELGLKNISTPRVEKQEKTLEKLIKEIGKPTAERVYRYYKNHPMKEEEQKFVAGHFIGDDHDLWYKGERGVKAMLAKFGSTEERKSHGRSSGGAVPTATLQRPNEERQEDIWKKVAENIQMELKTFSRQYDKNAGGLLQNLEEISRETYNYREFLKKFAVQREFMKINDDEFDYIFYTYGLKLYDKMPLIEPLEYKEEKRIKDFVIAIDTSGSVSGELVQCFVQKTWNILKSTESFFSRINLHIIQCDAEIQEHVKITDQKSFDKYIKDMKIKGLGGTDFRPVFELVERLRKEKELTDLKGLIYFTDGNGTFPIKRPDYKVACIFVEGAQNNPKLPPWVIRLFLKQEDIEGEDYL